MLTDFQIFFTVGLSSKHVPGNEVIVKDLTTRHTRRYTTFGNVNVRKLAII